MSLGNDDSELLYEEIKAIFKDVFFSASRRSSSFLDTQEALRLDGHRIGCELI